MQVANSPGSESVKMWLLASSWVRSKGEMSITKYTKENRRIHD